MYVCIIITTRVSYYCVVTKMTSHVRACEQPRNTMKRTPLRGQPCP